MAIMGHIEIAHFRRGLISFARGRIFTVERLWTALASAAAVVTFESDSVIIIFI